MAVVSVMLILHEIKNWKTKHFEAPSTLEVTSAEHSDGHFSRGVTPSDLSHPGWGREVRSE